MAPIRSAATMPHSVRCTVTLTLFDAIKRTQFRENGENILARLRARLHEHALMLEGELLALLPAPTCGDRN